MSLSSCVHKSGVRVTPQEPIKLSIVDDDPNERCLTKRSVDQSGLLACDCLYSGGVEAIKGIPLSASEVVLIDVRMPDVPGMECARQLKSIQPHLIIILISGFGYPGVEAQARESGADAYLPKPISPCRLSETLAACLQRCTKGINRDPAPSATQSDQCWDIAIGSTSEWAAMIDQPTVRGALRRIVNRLELDFHAREDLLQEALIHFWSAVRQKPDQRLGWYLQSTRFYLHHLKRSGRSVDSPKRRSAQVSFPENSVERDQWRDSLEFDEGIMAEIQARDMLSFLVNRLKPIDQAILHALDNGFGVLEVAEKLHVPHPFVVRHRRQIGRMAIRLGLVS